MSRVAALRRLQQLVATHGLVRQEGNRYAVPHAEIREALHGEVIPELRAAYHECIAEWLRESGAAETGAPAPRPGQAAPGEPAHEDDPTRPFWRSHDIR